MAEAGGQSVVFSWKLFNYDLNDYSTSSNKLFFENWERRNQKQTIKLWRKAE